jgi:hypothetical protein
MSRLALGILLGGLACGSVEERTTETTPTPSVECPDGDWEKVTLELVREDETAQCLRTEPEERVAVPFCLDRVSSGQSYRCIRDDAGTDYVVFASASLIPPSGYSLCLKEDIFFTRPCYTECNTPTIGFPFLYTLCGEEETKVAGRCGELDSPYDENSPRRVQRRSGRCAAFLWGRGECVPDSPPDGGESLQAPVLPRWGLPSRHVVQAAPDQQLLSRHQPSDGYVCGLEQRAIGTGRVAMRTHAVEP